MQNSQCWFLDFVSVNQFGFNLLSFCFLVTCSMSKHFLEGSNQTFYSAKRDDIVNSNILRLTDIVVVPSAGQAAAAAGVRAAAVVCAGASGEPGAALLAAPARYVLQRDEAAVGEDLNINTFIRAVDI